LAIMRALAGGAGGLLRYRASPSARLVYMHLPRPSRHFGLCWPSGLGRTVTERSRLISYRRALRARGRASIWWSGMQPTNWLSASFGSSAVSRASRIALAAWARRSQWRGRGGLSPLPCAAPCLCGSAGRGLWQWLCRHSRGAARPLLVLAAGCPARLRAPP